MNHAPDNDDGTDRYRMTASGLPWFTTQRELEVFKRQGFACVYALGPDKGRPLRIQWSAEPRDQAERAQIYHWQSVQIREIVWTSGLPIAKRLDREIKAILDKAGRRMRGEWFDIDTALALGAFQVAADKSGLQTFTHTEMLRRVGDIIDAKTMRVLAST